MYFNSNLFLFYLFTKLKKMSDNPREAEKQMEKAIFIAADCWLEVFHLLPPSQLGLGIALISRRFDRRVDEHFKTRKWTLGEMKIRRKIGRNGAKKTKIVNFNGKALPIPQIPLPNKVIGFRHISIKFIDQNVLTFLRRFQRFFATYATLLSIHTKNVRISEFVMRNIWPMLKDIIHDMAFDTVNFRQMRQLAPSMLNDCPSLRGVDFGDNILPEFPPDDSANASDGQALAKWLLTPHPDNLPKLLFITIENSAVDQLLATVEQIKASFSSASTPVAFVIGVEFPSPIDSVLPFKLTNQLTGEHLTFTEPNEVLVLIRCPIAIVDENKWIIEAIEWIDGQKNKIDIFIRDDDGVVDGLLDGLPGPSGDQQQAEIDLSLD